MKKLVRGLKIKIMKVKVKRIKRRKIEYLGLVKRVCRLYREAK